MSKASELALALEEGRYEDADTDDVIQELRRLDRVNAELVEALMALLRHYPTDDDMQEAGWAASDIEAACNAYDDAKATLTSATKETT